MVATRRRSFILVVAVIAIGSFLVQSPAVPGEPAKILDDDDAAPVE